MGVHFPAVQSDNMIQFSTFSRTSGFLWHSSKWTDQFSRFLQYMSGFEVLPCSLNTDLHYVTSMFQLHEPISNVVATFIQQMWQPFRCILING